MALLSALTAHLDSLKRAKRLCVGFSGGADSHSLLHALIELAQQEVLPPVTALHVNHGLHEDAAGWAAHCGAIAADLGVEFHEKAVSIDAGTSLEAQARDARYAVFESFLDGGDVLLLGHHLDDQVETVLFRLIRGAGPSGLAGMPECRSLGAGLLLRPLLGVTRAQIEDYAANRNLSYLDDSSNADTRFDRNFLRHEVLPLIEARWPGYRSGFARSAALSGELAVSRSVDSHIEYTPLGGPYFSIGTSDTATLHRAIYHWLRALNAPLPEFVALEEFARQCLEAKGDKLPELQVRGYILQRWRHAIYLHPASVDHAFNVVCEVGKECLGPWGSLIWEEADLGLAKGATVKVRAPREGETVSLDKRPSRSIGQWLQEAGIPPYLRRGYPLVELDDEIVAVPGVGLAADTSESLLCKAGLVPVWIPSKIDFVN